ncbi:energy transducer TonB [Danxiaibacter flavus]|uniref:Energy transducer TonB n=1 Tax=Danxiaibacter flavus TaxID=3049108 RepID=A0ABV3ZBZ9_9BACT|nr:energy transducer TonB [Chitinophagaceae bacterium DXS]
MEANKILQADVLDIVFEGRNKAYGAYDLRKTYNKRVLYALTGMALLCFSGIGVSIFASSRKPNIVRPVAIDVIISKVVDEPKKEEPKVIPPKVEAPKPIAQQRVTTIEIVPDEKVTKQDEVPENKDLEDVKISLQTTPGEAGDYVNPPVEAKGVGAPEPIGTKEKDYETIMETVQIQAKFPGGFPEWEKFLRRNLRNEIPSENGAPAGDYKVIVSFIVNKDGSISEVRAENDPGFGTADEAVRVIKKSNQWIPAEQNGRKVIYRQRQAITFQVIDGN